MAPGHLLTHITGGTTGVQLTQRARLACAGAFICIRETAAKSVAIIDTANPSDTQRMPAPIELSCADPRTDCLYCHPVSETFP